MNIQLASDLHLDLLHPRWPGERLISPAQDADVLVLAGDIHQNSQATETFAPWVADREMPIVYVAGNHEFYGDSMQAVQQRLQESSSEHGIQYLERKAVVLGGVRFLGCTLWTDYALRSMFSREHAMEEIQRRLTDHYKISTDTGLFTPQDALALHMVSRQWLNEELAKPFDRKPPSTTCTLVTPFIE
jgi:predicted phosphodiesterase